MTQFLAKQLGLTISILMLAITNTVIAADMQAYQIDKDSGY